MADKFLSTLSKTAGRAQERVLQKLGKSDETVDEAFNQHVKNFYRQLAVATRLHKEARNFQQCINAMTIATKSLSECIVDAFDEGWSGASEFQEQAALMTKNWQQLQQHASELLSQSMSSYLNGKFPDLKNRISKRDRKLIDYDRYRHALNSIKAKSKSSDTKLSQAEEEHAQAKEIYEEMNASLNKELPQFFSDRIEFYQNVSHGLYSAMYNFSESSLKSIKRMHDISAGTTDIATPAHLDTLTTDATSRAATALSSSASFLEGPFSAPTAHTTTAAAAPSSNTLSSSSLSSSLSSSHPSSNHSSNHSSGSSAAPTASTNNTSHNSIHTTLSPSGSSLLNSSSKSGSSTNLTVTNSTSSGDLSSPGTNRSARGSNAGATANAAAAATSRAASSHDDDDEEITKKLHDLAMELGDGESTKSSSGNKKKQGPKVLFTVRATHQYQGLEDDELSFSKGDIITVIEPPNEDDLDEGWYFGIMQDGRKGVLPINFTERLDRNSKAYLL